MPSTHHSGLATRLSLSSTAPTGYLLLHLRVVGGTAGIRPLLLRRGIPRKAVVLVHNSGLRRIVCGLRREILLVLVMVLV